MYPRLLSPGRQEVTVVPSTGSGLKQSWYQILHVPLAGLATLGNLSHLLTFSFLVREMEREMTHCKNSCFEN